VPQASGTTSQLRAVWFADANTGTVVGDQGTILRTTDGGQHWVTQSSGVSELLLGVSFTDGAHGRAVGQLGTIVRTTDGGATWVREESGTNQDLYSVSFADASAGTAVGGFGAILRTIERTSCPHSVSYWKHKTARWPLDNLILGNQTYSKGELKDILITRESKRDASLIMGRQLIATRLNLAIGTDPTPVLDTIEDADHLLSGFSGKLPYNVDPESETGRAMVSDATILHDYNTGNLTSCSRK
jgi:hypothetical protein